MLPFLGGNFITTTIGITDTVIEHKLEHPYKGWLVVDIDTNGTIRRSNSVNLRKHRQIILVSTVVTEATIYIF